MEVLSIALFLPAEHILRMTLKSRLSYFWGFCRVRSNLTLFTVSVMTLSLPEPNLSAGSHCTRVSQAVLLRGAVGGCLLAVYVKTSSMKNTIFKNMFLAGCSCALRVSVEFAVSLSLICLVCSGILMVFLLAVAVFTFQTFMVKNWPINESEKEWSQVNI